MKAILQNNMREITQKKLATENRKSHYHEIKEVCPKGCCKICDCGYGSGGTHNQIIEENETKN